VTISFFNDLDIGKELCSGPLFHFLRAFHREEKLCSWFRLDHGFQEDNALEGYHVNGQNLVMASRRSSLDGR
jgi:hypothetical protein